MIKAYTIYDSPEVVMEANTGESDVDITLYRPLSKRLNDMIRSGERLEDLKRLKYHSDYLENMEDDENWTDPLIYRGYDRADLELMHKEEIEDIMHRLQSEQNSSDKVENLRIPEGNRKVNTQEDDIGEPKATMQKEPKSPNTDNSNIAM